MYHHLIVERIQNEYLLTCPSCKTPVYVAKQYQCVTPGNKPWLNSSDTVGGLWGLLSDSQKHPNAFDYTLADGICHVCRQGYYVVSASFINSNTHPNNLIDYVRKNINLNEIENFICHNGLKILNFTSIPEKWLLKTYDTPGGIMHSYVFGPFKRSRIDEQYGNNGIAMYGDIESEAFKNARDILFFSWDALRSLNANWEEASKMVPNKFDCSVSGVCVPHDDEQEDISQCIYCGKEIHNINNNWYSYDTPEVFKNNITEKYLSQTQEALNHVVQFIRKNHTLSNHSLSGQDEFHISLGKHAHIDNAISHIVGTDLQSLKQLCDGRPSHSLFVSKNLIKELLKESKNKSLNKIVNKILNAKE